MLLFGTIILFGVFCCVFLCSPSYSVFESDLERLSNDEADLQLPGNPGIYYVVVNVGRGTRISYVTNEYIFKVERG